MTRAFVLYPLAALAGGALLIGIAGLTILGWALEARRT